MSASLSAQQPSTENDDQPPRIPTEIEAIRQAHIKTAEACAVVAALFAGIQAQLLSGIPTDGINGLIKALSIFSYGGLVLSIGSSLSAMGLIDHLGHMPEEYWKSRPASQVPPSPHKSDFDLLKEYGGDSSIETTYNHCHTSLFLGASSLLIQICLLAWVKSSSTAVFVLVVLCVVWVFLFTYPGKLIFQLCKGFVVGLLGSH